MSYHANNFLQYSQKWKIRKSGPVTFTFNYDLEIQKFSRGYQDMCSWKISLS